MAAGAAYVRALRTKLSVAAGLVLERPWGKGHEGEEKEKEADQWRHKKEELAALVRTHLRHAEDPLEMIHHLASEVGFRVLGFRVLGFRLRGVTRTRLA
eukprot:264396-Prorocentrum_minimum.AAC.1